MSFVENFKIRFQKYIVGNILGCLFGGGMMYYLRPDPRAFLISFGAGLGTFIVILVIGSLIATWREKL